MNRELRGRLEGTLEVAVNRVGAADQLADARAVLLHKPESPCTSVLADCRPLYHAEIEPPAYWWMTLRFLAWSPWKPSS